MQKSVKKLLCLIVAAAMLLLAAGCGTPPGAAQSNEPAAAVQEDGGSLGEETDSGTEDGSSQAETSSGTEAGSSQEETSSGTEAGEEAGDAAQLSVEEDGEYSDKEHVALYLHTYGHLPSNYVTKKEAEASGWDSGEGNLYQVLPGKSIGGGRFGNYEGRLPEASGRQYYECDINYNPEGKTSGRVTRGPERIVYSNDGLIFYTADHYETFEQLY